LSGLAFVLPWCCRPLFHSPPLRPTTSRSFQGHQPRVLEVHSRRAIKAAQELEKQGIKVNINWKGPIREDDRDQQIQVVENFTVRRISGMVLAPLDSKALVAPVENALRAKISPS